MASFVRSRLITFRGYLASYMYRKQGSHHCMSEPNPLSATSVAFLTAGSHSGNMPYLEDQSPPQFPTRHMLRPILPGLGQTMPPQDTQQPQLSLKIWGQRRPTPGQPGQHRSLFYHGTHPVRQTAQRSALSGNAPPFISQLGDDLSDTNADNGQTPSGYKDLEEDCKPFTRSLAYTTPSQASPQQQSREPNSSKSLIGTTATGLEIPLTVEGTTGDTSAKL